MDRALSVSDLFSDNYSVFFTLQNNYLFEN